MNVLDRATRRRWAHPCQVVLVVGASELPVCSHRWEVTAGWCAGWRDLRCGPTDFDIYHDVRFIEVKP